MGIFDWFKKPRVSLEQLSYDVAYQIFPHHTHHKMPELLAMVASDPANVGKVFYFAACVGRAIRGLDIDAGKYRLHQVALDATRRCLVLEYPQPKPTGGSGQSFSDSIKAIQSGEMVIAPFFSAAIIEEGRDAVRFFVLGQASLGPGTVLRFVERDGQNRNLGPGPEPRLELFLQALARDF
ncbi:hypothetical protein [Massilia glaciei]|uniref:Uncharacterized protein n=1 Tax=Massilia glaciei TaxID=1524097 RepID=A0A2U2HMT2_9BURK|nr:hypothetical protein [Massilia glaciei]PWF48725.1 hypothetical protein C7C56_010485 [Massilia glaciei]